MKKVICEKLDYIVGKKLLENIDTILCDCDGVLYHGDSVISGAIEVVKKLKLLNKRFIYVTNNSTKTREQFAQKFNLMGFPAATEDVVCSSYVTAKTLKKLKYNGDIYCIGGSGFADELKNEGYKVTGFGAVDHSKEPFKEAGIFITDPNVKCVVVGMDEHFSYLKAAKACAYLSRPDTIFVASNSDASLPLADRVLPGTGSVLAMVTTAAQRQPDVICGKPHNPMYDVISEEFQLKKERTLMIGDRLDTDILFAGNCGLHSLLVLTGISNLNDVKVCSNSSNELNQLQIPEYYLESFADLLPILS